ncbi:NADH-quinone oxidoreductase subunit J family protein [Cytophaga hutchinsonii]|jgi:NADH-quinone oxidoreductase subunit J|uniref:NADH-quinone oxidoreductase subunit J n=1 Tax=Cytophaga hutchinsonii (strain ATCC 33406 / DSM 1761 / CIP 103989 / NBRC 15051 / NCIMB 9469 / D465) TaxID=269798 RepID=A0A6N4SQU4_CYTH3|nr:NADH-quinone oxidoreductase subunit J [Cytophaga hutchinsonii]ABG58645.1 NADH dehydrogenase subunit J [Cytophaga hutchinsonii ATCC 33406]SFX58723.1 NADH dehydrogenase subunit J [Cytophaga hutchinsonii ATCC 33406]
MGNILFYILSGITLCSALFVILSKNPVYSVLSLVITFCCITGHMLLLSADFLAVVNIIVYAGAIMVLFLFVIMMLNLNDAAAQPNKPFLSKLAACVSGGLLLISLVYLLKGYQVGSIDMSKLDHNFGSAQELGKILFNQFILPFEITSVLFLSAMIGAVMLGKKDLKDY